MTRGSQFTRGILCRNILTVSLLSFKINLKLYSSHSLKFSSMSTIDIISWLYIESVENFQWWQCLACCYPSAYISRKRSACSEAPLDKLCFNKFQESTFLRRHCKMESSRKFLPAVVLLLLIVAAKGTL